MNLSWELQLNIYAGKLAKIKMSECLNLNSITQFQTQALPYSTCAVLWKDSHQQSHSIPSKLGNTLHDHIHTARMSQYFQHKKNFMTGNKVPLTRRQGRNATAL